MVRMTKTRKVDKLGECASPRGSEQTKKLESITPLKHSEEDESEWEETMCPICWEHPHSAVLLRCSSNKKGCRTYMCNTGTHHSNCLNLFYKAFYKKLDTGARPSGKKVAAYNKCPMCRGKINGWKVVEAARCFMNSKPRSCSSDGCDFKGNYSELRQHVRLAHPFARPAGAHPRRVRERARRVRERDLEDEFNVLEREVEFGDGNIFVLLSHISIRQ